MKDGTQALVNSNGNFGEISSSRLSLLASKDRDFLLSPTGAQMPSIHELHMPDVCSPFQYVMMCRPAIVVVEDQASQAKDKCRLNHSSSLVLALMLFVVHVAQYFLQIVGHFGGPSLS